MKTIKKHYGKTTENSWRLKQDSKNEYFNRESRRRRREKSHIRQ